MLKQPSANDCKVHASHTSWLTSAAKCARSATKQDETGMRYEFRFNFFMKLSFHGAARTVTGSKHLITLRNGKNILLDCGMFQGMGRETEKLNASFGFDPSGVEILILSHAHIDHS